MNDARSTIHVEYTDSRGLQQLMKLEFPDSHAAEWLASLRALLAAAPTIPATVSHWHWALSCAAATGEAGAKAGCVARSEVRNLLCCANVDVSSKLVNDAIAAAEETALPPYLSADDGRFSPIQVAVRASPSPPHPFVAPPPPPPFRRTFSPHPPSTLLLPGAGHERAAAAERDAARDLSPL